VLKNVTSLQGNWLFADFPQRQGLSEIKVALPNPLINAGVEAWKKLLPFSALCVY
jgi:hypothetical protein